MQVLDRDGFGVEMWGIEPHAATGVEPSAAPSHPRQLFFIRDQFQLQHRTLFGECFIQQFVKLLPISRCAH